MRFALALTTLAAVALAAPLESLVVRQDDVSAIIAALASANPHEAEFGVNPEEVELAEDPEDFEAAELGLEARGVDSTPDAKITERDLDLAGDDDEEEVFKRALEQIQNEEAAVSKRDVESDQDDEEAEITERDLELNEDDEDAEVVKRALQEEEEDAF